MRGPPGHPSDDRGFSLVEVMVGAAIMSVATAIAAAGFVQMYRATELADSAAQTQTNLTDAFARLDREVRYAYRINPAYQVGTATYAVDYIIDAYAGTQWCIQLSLPIGGGTLLRRQWPQESTSADPAAFTTGIARDLFPGTANLNPFTVRPAGTDDSNLDRLLMNVTSTVGVGAAGGTRNYNLQFTALNTTTDDLSVPNICTKN